MSPRDPADTQQSCQSREEQRKEERKGKYNQYPNGNRQTDQRAGYGDDSLV